MEKRNLAASRHVLRWMRLAPLVIAAFAGIALAISMVRFQMQPIGHDQSWGLYAAQQVLHGVKLDGPHLLEVNPPFIIWFFSLLVMLASALHISLKAGFDVVMLVLMLLLSAWSAFLFRRLYPTLRITLWIFIALQLYLISDRLPSDNYGQREHLVTYFFTPYLIAAACRLTSHRIGSLESIFIGISTAIGVCMKPQHGLEVALVELLILLSLRSLRGWFNLIPVTCAVFVATYLGAVLLFTPTYLTEVVPLLKTTYWGFDVSYSAVVGVILRQVLSFGLIVTLFAVLYRRLRTRALLMVYLAAACGALLAYVQQHKGWTYQSISFRFFGMVLFILILGDLVDRTISDDEKPIPMTWAVVTLFATLVVGLPWFHAHLRATPQDKKKEALAQIYSVYPEGTPVGFLSVDPWQFPEVMNQNKIWASRYMHLWLLPALVRSEDPQDTEIAKHLPPAELERLSAMQRQTTAADLDYWKPPVVVVDPCGMSNICERLKRERYGDLLGWFAVDPAFRDQWSHYRFQRRMQDMDVYARI